jgi:hypothetical protein
MIGGGDMFSVKMEQVGDLARASQQHRSSPVTF